MVRIIDTNKHGVRREIDHQYKKGKKNARKKEVNSSRKIQKIEETDGTSRDGSKRT